jgi:hypothetical protein
VFFLTSVSNIAAQAEEALNEPSALETLTNLRSEMEAIQKRMKETAQEAVREGTKAIFRDFGDIVYCFGWTQYTPFFNDGDPCEFGMHELSIVGWEDIDEDVRTQGPDDIEEWLRDNTEWPYETYGVFEGFSDNAKVSYTSKYAPERNKQGDPRYDDAKGAIEQVYAALEHNDIAKDIFGDHVQVMFRADGVVVDEHNHD